MRGNTKRQCAKSGEPWQDKNGSLHWLDRELKLHRDGAPARIDTDGSEYWYQHGKLHREDGPAVISKGRAPNWIAEYVQHDPYAKENPEPWWEGYQEWHLNGKLQRKLLDNGLQEFHDEKPDTVRVVWPDGRQEWYGDGCLHRDGAPAVIHPDGRVEWWHQGDNITDEVNSRCRDMLAQAPWFATSTAKMIYFQILQDKKERAD